MFIVEKILSLVAPHYCIACGGEGSVVCDWCLPDIAEPLPSRCYICRSATADSRVCPKCRRKSALKHVWVRTAYDGKARQLVLDFKYKRKRAAAAPVALLMSESLPYFDPDTIVTHVPTATNRVRRRGYDHAELTARALARISGLPYEAMLLRATHTRQVGSGRAERFRQMEGAFVSRGAGKPAGRRVLLIDDLVTTGATLESAARCLRSHGAKEVNAAVFAQR